VNEEGTEAAAATSVEIGVTSMPPMIVVDRPFLFAIREKLSGAILFMGVVKDPALGAR
jgi:serpin B